MEDQNFKAVRNMSKGGLSGQEYVNASVVWSRAGCTCSRYSETSRYSENFEGQVMGALSIEIYEYMSCSDRSGTVSDIVIQIFV